MKMDPEKNLHQPYKQNKSVISWINSQLLQNSKTLKKAEFVKREFFNLEKQPKCAKPRLRKLLANSMSTKVKLITLKPL